MKKQEIIFRSIGCSVIDGGNKFTQLGLSKKLGISLSIVNGAVRNLSNINAVRILQKSFEVIALERVLLYWATHRSLKKDIAYATRAEESVNEIERSMPEDIAFTGYTAYRYLYGEVPADYSEIYLYATDSALGEIKKRFVQNQKRPNIIVLKCDSEMRDAISGHRLKKMCVCPAQLFVDLWNMPEWYAKDFVDALSGRLLP